MTTETLEKQIEEKKQRGLVFLAMRPINPDRKNPFAELNIKYQNQGIPFELDTVQESLTMGITTLYSVLYVDEHRAEDARKLMEPEYCGTINSIPLW